MDATTGKRPFCHRLAVGVLFLVSVTLPVQAEDAIGDSEGLWEYAGLVTGDGTSLPLTGIFLIKDGMFLQQSIFNEEPFAEAGSMAHAGPFWADDQGFGLISEQTLSLDPKGAPVLRSAGEIEHSIDVTRAGDDLTIVFGSGTRQTLKRLGDAADTRLYKFEDGALAFANGYFVLVAGDEERIVSGYGRYRAVGSDLTLEVIRWAESDGASVINQRDIAMTAELTADALRLGDGRMFPIID
ncbi:MAG: hypothetical protein AAGL66_12765 [Pseudomonadota bacterium]